MSTNNLNNLGPLTHMPFITAGHVFFCIGGQFNDSGSRRWKIHRIDCASGRVVRLNTRMDNRCTECSPSAWQDETGWHVSFIAGGVPGNERFYIYQLNGPTLEDLGEPVPVKPARTGFVYRDGLVWGSPEDVVHVEKAAQRTHINLPGCQIYRVSYRADIPEILLITVFVADDTRFATVSHDTRSGESWEIECDGEAAYKCSMFGGSVMYAHRGEDFEDREVRLATSCRLLPTTLVRQECGVPSHG